MKFYYEMNIIMLRKALKDIRKRFPEQETEELATAVDGDISNETPFISSFTIEGQYGRIGTIGWHPDGFWAITSIVKEEN